MNAISTGTHTSPSGAVHWEAQGEGEPVVLLHGTPFSSFIWREIAPALARDHQVFTFDLPGYGRSERRPGQDSDWPRRPGCSPGSWTTGGWSARG